MNRVEQIEDAIVTGTDNLFAGANVKTGYPTTREDLHVTIRIASDFHDFLVKYGESPDAEQIDYMAGTIRSGMDEFYQLAYICRSIVRANKNERVGPHEQWDFHALRKMFMSGFEHLADPDVSAGDKLASLFALTHLELVFLARHFPSAIFAERASDSWTIAEVRRDIDRMLGGKSSFSKE